LNKAKQICDDLEYLENVGLTNEQLRTLHHWSDRPEAAARVSFASARDYFAKGQAMRANNAAFAERLHLIVDLHQRGLGALVEQALSKFPL
jgi:hypothetical protein